MTGISPSGRPFALEMSVLVSTITVYTFSALAVCFPFPPSGEDLFSIYLFGSGSSAAPSFPVQVSKGSSFYFSRTGGRVERGTVCG